MATSLVGFFLATAESYMLGRIPPSFAMGVRTFDRGKLSCLPLGRATLYRVNVQLDDKNVKAFQSAWKEELGEEISEADAGIRLLQLVELNCALLEYLAQREEPKT